MNTESLMAHRVFSPRAVRAAVPVTMLTAGPIRVVLTDHPEDIVAAQRLRYRVFAAEPGFSDRIGDPLLGRDSDRFDAFCEHLVVQHESDGVIGGARLLPPARAAAAGGRYAAEEFDLDGLGEFLPAAVEMGRAVVDERHRSGTVTALMWAALLRYLEAGGHRRVMGCVSVPLTADPTGSAPGANLRAIRDQLRDRHRASGLSVRPRSPAMVCGRRLDDIDPAPAAQLPPLLRGYLRLGAQVCGEPAIDEVFGVADFLMVLDLDTACSRYLDRLAASAARLGG